jgi:hypothetical protein
MHAGPTGCTRERLDVAARAAIAATFLGGLPLDPQHLHDDLSTRTHQFDAARRASATSTSGLSVRDHQSDAGLVIHPA